MQCGRFRSAKSCSAHPPKADLLLLSETKLFRIPAIKGSIGEIGIYFLDKYETLLRKTLCILPRTVKFDLTASLAIISGYGFYHMSAPFISKGYITGIPYQSGYATCRQIVSPYPLPFLLLVKIYQCQ